jgi:hypothetical protein
VIAVGNGPLDFINDLAVNPGDLTVEVQYPPEG